MPLYAGRFFKEFGKEISQCYKQIYKDAIAVLEPHLIFHRFASYDDVVSTGAGKLEKAVSTFCAEGIYHTAATIGTGFKIPRITKTSFKKSLNKQSSSSSADLGAGP